MIKKQKLLLAALNFIEHYVLLKKNVLNQLQIILLYAVGQSENIT